jgi:dienelactone hydrolase
MNALSILNRRRMIQWGIMSAGGSALAKMLGVEAWAQNLGPGNKGVGQTGGRDEAQLFQGKGLPGGAQTEIRLNQSIYTEDPDEWEVALRMKPFNPQSWYEEWRRVALRNEEMAEGYAGQGLKASAHEFYMRAFQFHRLSIVYQQDTDATMMPGYRKMREMFDKAWQMDNPPFERVTVTVDGHQLAGFFRKPGGPAGTRFPAIIAYQGADSLAENTILGAGGLVDRGMAVLVVDLPGQGAAKRLQNLYMPPDTERFVKDLVNYLERRPDVDPNRIGLQGISMGSYSAPRAASGEPRIKAVYVSAGSHDLLRDLFEYFPPIQDRVRWIVGAKDLAETRTKLRDYTVANVARNIRCPMLIGYGPTDRIMDPQGAFRLYEAAVNSERQMWSGGGHPHHDAKSGGPRELRLPTDEDWAAKRLGAA